MKICVLQGPNLNLTGLREPGVYGARTLEDIHRRIAQRAEELGVEVEFYQSNWEGALIDKLHAWPLHGGRCVFNPGAYSHTAMRCGMPSRPLPCRG